MAQEPRVLVDRQGPILRVTLNRPEVRNAFDEESISAVAETFRKASRDRGLRAVVVAGAGSDFCAGADIRWMRRAAGYRLARNRGDAMRLVGMCRAIDECAVPVIARVHGVCFGGGLGIVAASDIAVCASDAIMAFSECRLGILPAVVSTFVIPKIGVSQARRYFLTAETFGPDAARAIGLVHEVAPAAELDARIAALTGWLLKAAPGAVREAKAMLRAVEGLPMDEKIAVTVRTLARARAGAEAKEGLSAFLEKRAAAWVPAPPPAKVS